MGTARIILGHRSAAITEVYAELDQQKAMRAMVRDVVSNVNFWPTSLGNINANEWSHVVMVLDGGKGYRMYINGRLDWAVDNANLGLYNYSQYGYLGLGTSSGSYLDGLLDEVMVFNQSLTDMQANELSNAQAAGYGRFTVLHDAAGNLTRDHRGYEYEYDYENRMTLVKKPLGAGFVAVATFDYDALGRRIEKVDAIAGTTRRYYYDDQRVAVQTQVSGSVETDDRYFVFGNYIDEVLVMHAGAGDFYYAHDHLYSPVALLDDDGDVLERYEYDAFGKAQIMAADFSSRTASLYGNPYYFTGRELDTLDAGNCTLMHYRHRAYNPEIGRFMQQDPFGTASISSHKNKINVLSQYHDGLSLYQYAIGNPVMNADPHGLWCIGVANPFTPGITVMPPPPVLAFPVTAGIKIMAEQRYYLCSKSPYFRICDTVQLSVLVGTVLAATVDLLSISVSYNPNEPLSGYSTGIGLEGGFTEPGVPGWALSIEYNLNSGEATVTIPKVTYGLAAYAAFKVTGNCTGCSDFCDPNGFIKRLNALKKCLNNVEANIKQTLRDISRKHNKDELPKTITHKHSDASEYSLPLK